MFSLRDVIFSHSTFCLLLSEHTLGGGLTVIPKRPFGSSVCFEYRLKPAALSAD